MLYAIYGCINDKNLFSVYDYVKKKWMSCNSSVIKFTHLISYFILFLVIKSLSTRFCIVHKCLYPTGIVCFCRCMLSWCSVVFPYGSTICVGHIPSSCPDCTRNAQKHEFDLMPFFRSHLLKTNSLVTVIWFLYKDEMCMWSHSQPHCSCSSYLPILYMHLYVHVI